MRIAKLLIEKGANLNARDKDNKTALFYTISRSYYIKSNEIAKLLIEKGANLTLNGDLYTSRYSKKNGKYEKIIHLMIYGWTLLNEAIKHNNNEIIKLLIEKGIDIHEVDENKNSPLKNSYEMNNKEITKLLLSNGASSQEAYDETLNYEEHATAYKVEKQWFLDLIIHKNNPKKLVNILTNFRKDTPIKYTTHIWDMNFTSEYGDFDGYIAKVREDWDKIENDLKALSQNIHKKIYNFLLNKEANKNWCSKDGDDVCIGWSSLVGLREWCNNGNNPFACRLEKSYKIEGKTITTFGEVINIFKQEIQIRNENNVLENIFTDIEEKLDDELDSVFEIETIKLKGKSFYTDVEKFKNVLDRIFSEIKKRQEFNKIRVEMKEDKNEKYMELYITQMGSKSNRSKEEMLNISSGGDMATIKENLKNLCDWSIESCDEEEAYKVNYLKNDNIANTEVLDTIPDGFTYIMRFYR